MVLSVDRQSPEQIKEEIKRLHPDLLADLPEYVQQIFEHLDFYPTGPEQAAILKCMKRRIAVYGGEQSGKSHLSDKIFQERWPQDRNLHTDLGDGQNPPLLYWMVGADYTQVTEEFRYIEQSFRDLGIGDNAIKVRTPEQAGFIRVHYPGERQPRINIECKSARDPSKIARQSPCGIIVCEAGQLTVDIFERINGRLGPRRGWLYMSGTLEGSLGWYPNLKEMWASGHGDAQSFSLPTPSNLYRYPGGWNDPEILRIQAESSDEFFTMRIKGEVVPPRGRVFPEFRSDLHIQHCGYNSEFPVHLWEDPGYGQANHNAHALEVVQQIDGQLRVIDEIYEVGLTTREIIDIAQSRPWWGASKFLVSDPHYKDQHHANDSVSDVWIHYAGLYAAGERVHLMPGHERLKTYLKPDPITGAPKIIIDPHCQGILSEFGMALNPFDNQYHAYRWKEDREGNAVGQEPIDAYNHGIKALIYGIVYNFGYARDGSSNVIRVIKHRRR